MKVKVLHKTYTVLEMKEPTCPDGTKANGFCDFANTRIVVGSGLEINDRREVLLHELLHAVDEAISVGLKEKEIHQMSVGIFMVLKENPVLRKYLFGKE